MDKYRMKKVENKIVVDEITGEITDLYIKEKYKYDEFIMLFLRSIVDVTKLSGNEMRTLAFILKNSNYKQNYSSIGNIFINTQSFKDDCRNSGFNVSDSNINKYVSSLAKKNFIIKHKRGEYILNPEYFFKGTLNERMNAIVEIQYVNNYKVTLMTPNKKEATQ